jgi:hypothetical protein
MATGNETKIILTAEDRTGNAFSTAKSKLSGLADEARAAAGGVGALGAAFGVLGGVAAGAISVSALKGAVDMLDMLDDLSEKTGIATESLSALRYAGEVVGTPVEALATGIRKLSLNMAAAAGGGKEQAAAFQAIGVAFKNLDGSLRGSDAVLGDIANKFAAFRDGPEKAALAVELFGKAGADMIPLLNKGASGIADLRTEAERLGVVFSGDLAANAAEFNDNLKKISLSGQAFATTMAGQVLPTLNELARVFLESKDGSNSLAQILGTGLKTAIEAVALLGANVSFVLQGIGREIGAIAAQSVALATLDIKGFKAISTAVKEDGERAREELAALEQRILGLGKMPSFVGPQLPTGFDESFAALMRQYQAAAPVVKKLGDTAKATADEFGKLIDKITGKASGTDADFSKNINTLNKALADGRLSWEDYTKVVGQYIAQQPAAVEATKALTKEMEAAQKVAEERQALRIKEDAAIQQWLRDQEAVAAQSLKSINERIQGLKDEEAAVALAQQQNISLAQAVEQVTLGRLREQQAVLIVGSTAYDNVQKEIEARERLIGVINTKDLREKESAGWASVFASIDSTAHDAWTNVWESGSSAFKRLGQTLKASILDVLYQMTIRPFIVKISASILGTGLSTAASAATGSGSSVLSGAGNMAGLLTGASSFGNFAGTAYANLTGTGIDGLLATNAAFGTAAAEGMGSIMSGLMTAAPYLAAVAAVYAIAKALDHSGTPHTGGGSQYSASGGLVNASSGAIFNSGFTGIAYSASTEQMTAGLVQSIVGILDATAITFGKAAGYQAAASFADDSSKDGAWGSLFIRNLQGVITDWQAGGTSFRTFSDGSAGSAEYLAAISQDVRKAIDGIGLPDWATQMLNSLGDAPTLEQLTSTVDAITKTQATLTQLGASVDGFATLAGSAVLNIISASGGLEAFATNLATFNENFFSDSEKFAAKLSSLNQTLANMAAGGAFADTAAQFNQLITEPTRANFRALVEAQDLTTTSGQKTYAALLGLSGVVAELTPAAEAAADAVATLQQASTSMADVFDAFDAAAERLFNATELRAYKIDRIQQQLAAQGFNVSTEAIGAATVDVLRSVMASFDLGTEQGRRAAVALSGLTGAILDLNASAAAAATESVAAFAAASTSMSDVFTAFDAAAERLFNATELRAYKIDRIQQQLAAQGFNVSTEAIGSATVESLRAVMASFDLTTEPGRRAAVVLSGMTGAILDLNAATAETTGTLGSMSAILSQRAGLSASLASAIGDTAMLRQRELDALDPSNRALQQVIYNITDMQAAVSALASQASASAASIAALQNSIAAYAQTAAQAQDLMNAISVAGGGADNSQAALWANISTGTLTEQMATIRQLLGLVTQSIAADTTAAQAAMAEGARAAQKAIEDANAAQLKGAQEQLAAAEKMVDVGRELRDYVQGLRIGNLSALTPAEKLALAASAYNTTLGRASAGDATAMSALQGSAGAYLEQARAFDPAAYNAIFAQVTGTLDSFGSSLITDGERQAATATAQLSELQTIAASIAAQTQASSVSNIISEANAAKLAQLNELVAGIQAQAVVQAAEAQARLTEEQARATAIATEQAAAQAALLQAQQQGRDALVSLPTVLNDNNLALIAEITRLNERIATLEATVVQVGLAQINTAVSVGAQTATAVADGIATAAHAATSTPVVV